MKLRLLSDMAGIDYGYNKGDIITVNDKDAIRRYIENNIAEPVTTSKKETAAKKTSEIKTAVGE